MDNYTEYLSESFRNLQLTLNDSGTRPILFVGSGISRRYLNAPNWEELLKLLIDQNPNIRHPLGYFRQNSSSLPELASLLVDYYKDYAWDNYEKDIYPKSLYESSDKTLFVKYQISKIFETLMNSFQINGHQHEQEIELFKRLQPHAIITTNYDKLLEGIFPEHQVIVGQQVVKSKDATKIGRILKIHGCMDKHQEIIISKEDYELFEEKQKYLTAKILTYFMEHPVIFLGYSVSDENIKSILSDIAGIVTESPDEIVDNIWFIDWSKDSVEPNERPPQDKNILLGEGKSIRINYIKLNSFVPLLDNLYQEDVSSVNALINFQDMVYNIIKSKSISELSVDYVTMRTIENENNLAERIGFQKIDPELMEGNQSLTVLGVGTIADPETVMLRYPFRLTDIARELGYEHFNYANRLIEYISNETGYNIKESNNRYHFELKHGKSNLRLYSSEALEVLSKAKNNEAYTILNDNGEEINIEFAL
ncbi:SIR2 family protein [Bacillus weihaiensis]|uniref:SIR2 family protein n=1 Tax=Bacillus weihaiensis TaxID=1547283 RepID=UPI00235723F3|nr:SIR2 family protein [Bacillus weihaiensis]